ncbi:hypothetical protein L3Q82_002196 [Scortum barcoo]|uniref:Uncharacterized protein n=1 Tax=Scortum barcoo TaxID=214431 RepID=A0ACB8W337_9TELE|nr:hypothetical protein L3Q82_002196 [Scortum barcoo]
MVWPPQSPDLSPTELVWDELDRSVRKACPTNQQSLIDELKKAWKAIPGTYLKKLVERMPRICHAVVKARGMGGFVLRPHCDLQCVAARFPVQCDTVEMRISASESEIEAPSQKKMDCFFCLLRLEELSVFMSYFQAQGQQDC